ncbi:MAG: tetratricopeptide repeat protein [Bacteroidetes bacterium]|nr:tetratricopeptide repeat protein [Bacteroidota bacterium]
MQKSKTAGKQVENKKSIWDIITRYPWICLILFAVLFLIYGQVLSFTTGKLDEDEIIIANLPLLRDFGNVKTVVMRDAFFTETDSHFYRPMQNLSFMIDVHLSGGKGWGSYLLNLLLHGTTCCLLFYLLTLLSDNRRIAFLCVLFFAVQPVFVQAIAWAPSRGDLLIGMFGILSFVFFILFVRLNHYYYLVLHIVSFALALFSKETAILFPVIFSFYYFLIEKTRKAGMTSYIILIICYMLLIILYLLFRDLVVKATITGQVFGLMPLFSNLRTIPEFITKFFLPFSLAPMPEFSLYNTITGIILAGLLVWAVSRYRSGDLLFSLFSLTWFLTFALPGLMYTHELGNAAYDYLEHRSYLPMTGILLLLFFFINKAPTLRKNKVLVTAMLTMIFCYAIYTHQYAKNYENADVYYNYAIKSNPHSALAFNNRGLNLYLKDDFQGAINDCNNALSIKPDYAEVYTLRGNSRKQLRDYAGSIEDYRLALRFKPKLFLVWYALGGSLNNLGKKQEALQVYDTAIMLNPAFSPGYMIRGTVKFQLQEYKNAIKDFNHSIDLNKENPDAYLYRGDSFYMLNEKEQACRDWKTANDQGSQKAGEQIIQYCLKK